MIISLMMYIVYSRWQDSSCVSLAIIFANSQKSKILLSHLVPGYNFRKNKMSQNDDCCFPGCSPGVDRHSCMHLWIFCILKFLLFSLSHLVPGYNFRFLQKLPRRCRLTAWLGLQLDDASICMNVYLSFNRPYLSWVYNLYILLSMPNSLR